MKDSIVWQIVDRVRGAMDPWRALELVLQVLVWEKWSREGRLPTSLTISRALNPEQYVSIWQQLGNHSDTLRQAFPDARTVTLSGASTLQATLELILHLRDTGALKTDDAADVMSGLSAGSGGEAARPPELADLMSALCQIKSGNTVYAPWDSSAQFSVRCMRQGAQVFLETPLPSPMPALIGLLVDGPLALSHSDPISSPAAVEGGKQRQFDLAIAFPPLNQRYESDVVTRDWFSRFPEKTQSGAVLAIRHLLGHAIRRIVVAVPSSLLFGRGADFSLREDLVRRGVVEAVVAMPGGILIGTNTPFALLVLDPRGGHQFVRFINADRDRFREQTSKARAKLINILALSSLVLGEPVDDDGVAVIPVGEVLANDAQLQVSRYVVAASQKRLQAKMARAKTVPLGELITTIRPVPTKQAEGDDCIEVREVGASDLPPFGYIKSPAKTAIVDRHTVQPKQFLMPHDIVLVVKGSVGKLGIVPADVPAPGEGGWMAGPSAIVLRVDRGTGVEPRALALQLRSPLGQALLGSIISGGATIQMINLHELTRLAVLLPPLEEASEAAMALEEEARIQDEIDRLYRRQADIAARMWTLD